MKRLTFVFAAAVAVLFSVRPAAADEATAAPVTVPPQAPPAAAPKVDPNTFSVYWKDGLRFDSQDKAFRLKLGGRVHLDWAWFDEDKDLKVKNGGGSKDGAEIRRARLYMSGVIYDRVIFKTDYGFEGGDVDMKDVFVGLKDLPWLGTLQIGHFKEPFSLEELTSSNYITFMERSVMNVFVPVRNLGFAVDNAFLDERLTVMVGGFNDADDAGETTSDNWNATGRVTGLPCLQDNGNLIHLGGSFSYRDLDGLDPVRLQQRPDSHLARRYVDTQQPDPVVAGATVQTLCPGGSCENGYVFGAEAAGVFGPFSLQGEWTGSLVEQNGADDPFLYGYYVFGSWFVTGEHRPYEQAHGVFSRVKPEHNFLDGKGGTGAVELALRYDYLTLNDELVRGGKIADVTFGVNWYLNPNARVMTQYVHSDVKNRPYPNIPGASTIGYNQADADSVMLRFQVDF